MFPIDQHTVFLTLAGSQAHGTARDGSDVDIRGVCVAPLSLRLSLFRSFEQYEGDLPEPLAGVAIPRILNHPTASRALATKTECLIFDLAKFLRLCATANPNALEILFADEQDWLFAAPAWRRIHAERRSFLTKKVQQSFQGYAMAQLKKIKTHRSWMLDPPIKRPSREDFGLLTTDVALNRSVRNRIERSIDAKIRSYSIDDIAMPDSTRLAVRERLHAFCKDALAAKGEGMNEQAQAVATHSLRLPPEAVSALKAEKNYQLALKRWQSYQAWKAHRSPFRTALEQKHGYDTKHAMHLVRLMHMGVEALKTGDLRVRRNDAAELSAIRDGAVPFDALLTAISYLQESMEKAAATTTLPADVDHMQVDRLFTATLESR